MGLVFIVFFCDRGFLNLEKGRFKKVFSSILLEYLYIGN